MSQSPVLKITAFKMKIAMQRDLTQARDKASAIHLDTIHRYQEFHILREPKTFEGLGSFAKIQNNKKGARKGAFLNFNLGDEGRI